MTYELDIVIVTYNSAEVLTDLLDTLSVAIRALPDVRVIIADNDSSDASPRIAEEHPIGAKVVHVGYNAGYSAGINRAVARFGRNGPLLLLNADIRLKADCISRMIGELATPRVGVVVPKMLHEDGTLTFSIRKEPSIVTAWSEALLGGKLAGRIGLGEINRRELDYAASGEIMLASGAILMVSAAARKEVGRWDERYFLYSEEVDYQRRAREAGFHVRYAADALCTHIGGDSNVNPRLFSILTANRLRYYREHHGAAATFAFRLAVATWAGLRYAFGPTYRAAFRASWMSAAEVGQLLPARPTEAAEL